MKDRERMSHTFSFSPWSSTFKASSAASGGHALVTMMIKDVYFSSGKEQNILLLPVLFTPSWFSMPAEANGDAAAVPGNFDCASLILWYLWYCLVVDFDFVLTSLLILFHFVSFCFLLSSLCAPTSRGSNESCRKTCASKVASRMAQATLTLNEMHLRSPEGTALNKELKRPIWGILGF